MEKSHENVQENVQEKKPKTWDEAVSELRAFIIRSKQEEQQQLEAEKNQ